MSYYKYVPIITHQGTKFHHSPVLFVIREPCEQKNSAHDLAPFFSKNESSPLKHIYSAEDLDKH
jgi:hypothetical protein